MKIKLPFLLISMFFFTGCSPSEDTAIDQGFPVINDTVLEKDEDISNELKAIPMSDSHENGRFFLISHTSESGIESVDYVRKGNDSDSYGRMKIKCSSNEIKKYSVDNFEGLNSGDLGSWYTPAPDWTDKDIFSFICN